MPLLSLNGVSKRFAGVTAVDQVSFAFDRGQVVGFLGPNGAGKTTTMRLITQFYEPDEGAITLDGTPLAVAAREAKRRIGYLAENNPLYEEMLVADYLAFIADLRELAGASRARSFDEAVTATGIETVYYRPIGELSKGYRQRVGLAQAILHRPDLLVLDEPTEGLDPNQRVEIRQLIGTLGRDRTVLLSTHVLSEVQQSCSRLLIISRGKIVADGPVDRLMERASGAVEIAVEAAGDGIALALRGLPGARNVAVSRTGGDGRVALTLTADRTADLRPEIFALAKARGWTLFELHQETGSLEELFLVPAVTMRALAEDARSGTLEVVLAQPVTELELVLGKYVGAVLFLVIALGLTLPIPLGLALGAPLQAGVVVAQYVGSALLTAGIAGVGLWASSVSKNQVTAFILAVGVTFLLVLVGLDPLLVGLPPRLGQIAGSLGVLPHFTGITRGVIDLRDATYFLSLAALFLLLAYFALMRRKLTRRGATLQRLRLGTALVALGVVVVNLLGRHIGGRLDLTPGGAFTLSRATKQILGSLPDLVTIKLFASASLPSEVAFLKRDVDDLLSDYRGAGRGKVRVAVRDPSADTAALREARQLGIPAVQFNVLGRSELQVKEGYLGVAVQYAEGVKTIPFVQEGGDLEYRLTSEIRALTHRERPVVGVSETSDATSVRARRSFDALQEQLGRTYTARPLTLGDSAIAEDVKVLVLIGAPDSLRGRQQERLEQFLRRGGGALVMASGMALNPGTPVAYARPVAWNRLLKPYGVQIRSDMAYDLASNERIAVPAQFGQVLVSYPLWLRALSTKASPVNAQLNAVLLPWASTIDTTGAAPGSVTPLLATSRAGGQQQVTAFLTPARDTAPPLRGRLVVVGSADFASDRYAGNSPENVVFALNAVDWLAQDDALIAIRSKNRAPAPLAFTSGTKRDAVKYGNLIGIPVLLVAVGAARLWRRRLITRGTYRPQGAAQVA